MKENEPGNQFGLPDEEQFARENPLDSEDEPASLGFVLDNDIRELMHLDRIPRDDN